MAANKRSRRSARRRARHVVPIFSENSDTDGRALQALARGMAGGDARLAFKPIRNPPSLQRGASPKKEARWLDRIANVVDGESRRGNLLAVIVHRDADGPDPHGKFKQELERLIRDRFVAPGHAVVPVQEMEAWWLAYPEALEQARADWRGIAFTGDPEARSNPKEHLQQLTGRKSLKEKYRESDGPEIAKAIVDLDCLKDLSRAPASLQRFLTDVETILNSCP